MKRTILGKLSFIEMYMQEENGEGVLGVINFNLGIDG